jgi:hypothetical protein
MHGSVTYFILFHFSHSAVKSHVLSVGMVLPSHAPSVIRISSFAFCTKSTLFVNDFSATEARPEEGRDGRDNLPPNAPPPWGTPDPAVTDPALLDILRQPTISMSIMQ